MTEAEWLTCNEPTPMVQFVQEKASGRKLRLFACACCRRNWGLLTDERSRRGVEAAEAHADGFLTDEQATAACEAAAVVYSSESPLSMVQPVGLSEANSEAAQAVPALLLRYDTPNFAQWHASIVIYHNTSAASLEESGKHPLGLIADYAQTARRHGEQGDQSDLLRDIIGPLPFRQIDLSPSWVTLTAVALARQMYESRDFSPMPLLGDALQDAGCEEDAILSHCRSPGPHVRGCWVVDAVLGRQ